MAQNQKLGSHKTSIFVEDNMTKVIYHRTLIIKWNKDIIVLNSGGYNTVTTKLRMNQASNQFDLGIYIYQKDFVWYVKLSNGKTIEFYDNMTITRGVKYV